ncbi:MAG TPA: YfhO family protein [Candidatus Binatia bacterium]|jgi:hypothetical protein|nr:YfhO family protein [Candidatus Binatia bacterium]
MRTEGSWRVDVVVGLASALTFLAAWLGGGSLWEYVNGGDLHGMYLPWFEEVARSVWHEGRVPLWQEWQFGGTPALGLGHPSALYPPTLLLFAGLLSSWAALQLLYALHVAILGTGISALLRPQGVGPVPAVVATLVVTAVVMRGPLLAGVDHPSFLAATAWFPWMLYCWRRAVTGRMLPWSAGVALCYAMQWFAGYPDFPFDFVVLFALVALLSDDGPLWRRLVVVGLGLGLGAALAAAQVLPLADAVRESVRSEEGDQHVVIRSFFAVLSPVRLWTIARDTWGLPAVALGLVALTRVNRTRLAWTAGFVWAAFALTPPFAWLYLLPPWSGVRFPFGWGGGTAVFLGLLAATGVATLAGSPRRWVRGLGVVLALAATTQALVVVWRSPTALPAIAPGNPMFRAPVVPQAAERARLLAEAAGSDRILSERDGRAGAAIRYHLRMAMGHEPSLISRRIVHLLAAGGLYDNLGMFRDHDWQMLAAKPVVASLLGIGVVAISPTKAAPLERAGFTRIGTLPGGDVVLRRAALPRVRLVHRADIAPGGEAGSLAAVLATPDGRPDVAVLDEGSVHPPLAEVPAGAHEAVRIVDDAPERIVIEATVAAPALLVLGEAANDGWRADVDGTPAPILHADHAFRAVWLPAGQHTVVFTYAPWSVRIGMLVSLGAVVVMLAFVLMPARRG